MDFAPIARPEHWLRPAAIAAICGGRVLRDGPVAHGVCTDSRQLAALDLFVALPGERHDGHDFVRQALMGGAAGVVVARVTEELRAGLATPGPFVVQVPDTQHALLALAAEHRRRHQAVVIGITGSCGKTSTKDMLGHVLSGAMPSVYAARSFNNSIGVPHTLFRIDATTQAAVVELGTNGPGEIATLCRVARPDVGIVTLVAEAHLEGLRSLEGVAQEKGDLVRALPDDGVAILNGDDPRVAAMAGIGRARAVLVSLERETDWFASQVCVHARGTSFLVQGRHAVQLPRLGAHNVLNALLVIAAAHELDVPLATVLDRLATLPPTAHRLQVQVVGDVSLVDDTYNMNPASARAALRTLAAMQVPGRRVVVFGAMAELGESAGALHHALGGAVAGSRADLLVTVGPLARPIALGAKATGAPATAVRETADRAEALDLLQRELRPGDCVLVKGSRRFELDRLVAELVPRLQGPRSTGS
ncbi:MAG: UDP-N-acetylmuramoyl-tripeptide--D-alanyl-D-alanine ligase [Planctomycetes bacterium]|nr:UDP-N-acetylmuramoyl-tripeptide--D-alanyl-D-alanine ligase [Planctomycetota bacterium]